MMKTRQAPAQRSALAILFFCVFALGIPAQAATFQQGYDAGCNLGAMETYYEENDALFLATLALAENAGEQQYYEGVLEGYWDCALEPEPVGGPGVGTTCDFYGCTSNLEWFVIREPEPPVGWVASKVPMDTTVVCEAGDNYICAEFYQDGIVTLDGCCVHEDNDIGTTDPSKCNGEPTYLRDDIVY